MYKKGMVLGIVLLFVGAGVVPSITGNIEKTKSTENTYNILNTNFDDIIFFDDFDDNTKDMNKWTEVYTEGIWEETNGRAEFQANEGHTKYEGIESSEFTVSLSSTQSIVITWDVITDIDHYEDWQWVGDPYLNISDGTNWILTKYSRYHNDLMYRDSNDLEYITLEDNQLDGTWSNEIEIYSDRYSVRMDSYESGWVYDSLFSSNPTLTVKIYISNGGDYPDFWWRAGFDNVKVQQYGVNLPPNTPSTPSGETSGKTGTSYPYSTSTTDPDGDKVKYGWDWDGDGTVDQWDDNGGSYYTSGAAISTSHSWSTEGTYNVKVKAEDINGAQSSFSPAKTVVIDDGGGEAPSKPIITGPTSGNVNKTYTYCVTAESCTGNSIYYLIDWGDDTNTDWLGPYDSSETCKASNSWKKLDTYKIKAWAKDAGNGMTSDPSDELKVKITKGKGISVTITLLLKFLERHPSMLPPLRHLLGSMVYG